MRTKLIAFTLVMALLGGGGFWLYQQDQTPKAKTTGEQLTLVATTSGCSGAGCTGKNPSGLCDDGRTAAAIHTEYGMLELRFSKSCQANWGRFTPYRRTLEYWQGDGYVILPRVTAWNPNEASYGVAKRSFQDSTWSLMVDGTKTACTGVEVLMSRPGGFRPGPGQDEWDFRQRAGPGVLVGNMQE